MSTSVGHQNENKKMSERHVESECRMAMSEDWRGGVGVNYWDSENIMTGRMGDNDA